MRIIEETHDEIETSKSINSYMNNLRKALNDETATIVLYEQILKESIPTEAKEIINEILNDEKDHLVLINELLTEELQKQFPDYGDKEDAFPMTIDEEEDKSKEE